MKAAIKRLAPGTELRTAPEKVPPAGRAATDLPASSDGTRQLPTARNVMFTFPSLVNSCMATDIIPFFCGIEIAV